MFERLKLIIYFNRCGSRSRFSIDCNVVWISSTSFDAMSVFALFLSCGLMLLDAKSTIAIPSATAPTKSDQFTDAIKVLPERGDSGLLRTFLPNSTTPLPICYPNGFHQHSEAARLLHVLCTELGYTTVGNRYKETLLCDRVGIAPTSAGCSGLEAKVAHCPWNTLKNVTCRDVLGMQCTSCNSQVSAPTGSIYNPGFPHAYLFPLTCAWTIAVPDARGLQLQFENFSLPNLGKNECQSYVDLSYSTDRGLKNLRFCPEDLPSNFTINSSTAYVRFSSGFFVRYSNGSVDGTGYGFSIVYRAVSREISKIGSTLKIFIPVSLVVTFCLVCFCWYKWCKKGTERTSANVPNVPTREQLDVAFALCVSDMNGEIQQASSQNDKKLKEISVGDPAIRNITSSTSALEIPGKRLKSLFSTPRRALSENGCDSATVNSRRLAHVRTNLVARFSSSARSGSVFLSFKREDEFALEDGKEENAMKDDKKKLRSLSYVSLKDTEFYILEN